MTKKKKAARGWKSKASTPRSVHEELGALARATIARLERQDQRDREIQKQYEHEPMVGEATWHEHQTVVKHQRRIDA